MSADTHLCGPFFCPDCGTVLDNLTLLIQQRDADIANLERELRSKRSTISRLYGEQNAHPDAHEVIAYWRKHVHPTARELGGKRLKAASARLNGGYTKEQLKRSCDGYALKPYVVRGKGRIHEGPKDSWRADAALIFMDAEHVDEGLRIAERADDLRHVLTPPRPAERPPGPSMSPLGRAALRFASFGWFVFPCRARKKEPATRHGLLDAKRDEQAIEQCWTDNPQLNVAVRTGAESGIVVLDVDGETGWDSLHALEDQHGDLPKTASVVTPRGGEHLYFQHPGREIRNTTGFPGPGLDIRGDGGYVLAPPSVGTDGRLYEVDESAGVKPMPSWLLEALTERQRADNARIKATDWQRFILDGVAKGERDTRMTSYVGHLFALNLPPTEVLALAMVVNGQLRPPLTQKDLARIVGSIARR